MTELDKEEEETKRFNLAVDKIKHDDSGLVSYVRDDYGRNKRLSDILDELFEKYRHSASTPITHVKINQTVEGGKKYEKKIQLLEEKIESLEKKIDDTTRVMESFIDRTKRLELQNLETVSRENLEYLINEFNLNLPSETKGNTLSEMAGMFNEYSDGETDSVESLRSLREEDN
jgi:predicted RNase H-like nuclease (RuvC/YqgF family)